MTVDTSTAGLTGRTLPDDAFRVHTTAGRIDVAAALDVLSGKLAAHRVSGFVPEAHCRRIVRDFWSIPRAPRHGEGDDGVEAYIVGASHIERTVEEYLDDVAAWAPSVRALAPEDIDPLGRLRSALASAGLVVRAARHAGRPAGDAKAVMWNGSGTYQLLPHDDVAQLSDPLQQGFEIQGVRRVMAVNAYPAVPTSGGELRLWNIEPDDACRERLGLARSGFPYPPELLHDIPDLLVPVETGDLCLIDGNLLHAVLGSPRSAGRDGRLLLTCFTGLDPAGELLWWT